MNPHAFRRQILNLLCLPFHHQGNNLQSSIYKTLKAITLVRKEGLEPSTPSGLDFESSAFTNFATRAYHHNLWCPRRDSNPHAHYRHRLLRPAHLPITSLGQVIFKTLFLKFSRLPTNIGATGEIRTHTPRRTPDSDSGKTTNSITVANNSSNHFQS